MPSDSPLRAKRVSLEVDDLDEGDDISGPRVRRPHVDDDESERSIASDPVLAVARPMWAAFARRDFTDALQRAEAMLAAHPGHPVAEACARECRLELAARLHAPSAVPRLVASPPSPGSRITLNHRDGFVLSQIDGVSSVETLVDVCAMGRPELLAVLEKLVEAGLVVVVE